MDTLNALLTYIPLLVITVAIQYRLSCRVLGLKYKGLPTFFIMLMVLFFTGRLNMQLHIAGDIEGNTLYYGLITFLLNQFLFKGNLLKKGFFTVLVNCGFPITFYIFLPFAYYFFGEASETFLLTLKLLEWFNTLICAVCLEYIGKRFQHLSRDLPFDYTIYLTAVIVFVYVAIYSAYDRMLLINHALSLTTAFTLAAFACLGMVIVMAAIFAVDRQVYRSLKEQLHLIQAENFKSRELEWRKFSGFRHDIKNHLICLNTLLENQKTEQAAAYMRNLTDTVKQFDNPVQTGNDYADALLSVKYAEAAAEQIKVSIDMAIPSYGFIDPVDLCCILSNAFDNAIHACCRLEKGDKWITARAFIKQGQLVIEIKNSKPPHISVVNGKVFPKEITAGHGLGLDTVAAVVEKYGGILNLSAADAFSFSVLLPPLRS